VIESIDIFFLSYLLAMNGVQLSFLVLSAWEVGRRRAAQTPELDASTFSAETTPPVTIISPAHNEEATIVESVRGNLRVEYPQLQVIVVNDDSSDRTLELLKERFDLRPINVVVHKRLETSRIRSIMESRVDPRLLVVDKEHGGKADSLNVGLNLCRTPLVCCVDSDSILARRGLLHLVELLLHDDGNTLAVGGTIRLGNGCLVEDGEVKRCSLPKGWLARFQAVEYLRAFLFARMGFNRLGSNLILSGAFGLFVRDAVVEAGGYRTDTVGEDMELTVRLHSRMRARGVPYRIQQIPETVCFTEAPESAAVLGRQRDRWQRGLFESLWAHRFMMLNPRYGAIGMVGFPFYVVFELLGPVIELAGYAWFAATMILGVADPKFALLFTIVAVVWQFLISLETLALDQMYTNVYLSPKDRAFFLLAAFLETFGYRQLTLAARIRGMVRQIGGEKGWGRMERKGFEGGLR